MSTRGEGSGTGSSGGGSEGRSVLVEIERLLGSKFRIRLKDVASDGSSPEDVEVGDVDLPMHDLGRYQLLGEIAEGGVGQVLRCRDVDLGRDVAMKVLRKKHERDAGTIQRFVEEAQIGGQLQHPGVVPVFELGLREDRRPYFTMKYVRGMTLSAMLSERDDPQSDLRKFLSIFEQICQTIAFAHARSVIHRDIKPSNVLIGAYGEVQVTDWGFAKVLRKGGVHDERRASRTHSEVSVIETVRTYGEGSHSIPGSVMGTPAYMPPEQARGDVERLDARSDVFSLGAVLCEILTGAPPYQAENTEQLLLLAGRAQLDDAYARLDESGADERLIRLTRMCLSPEPKSRPKNARVLGKAMSAFLDSVEARRRDALVEAAKAKVQAKGDRRIRRLAIALAVTLFLIVVGGGGTIGYLATTRASEKAEIRRNVTGLIARATDLAAEARGSGKPDPARWVAAVAVAKEGLALAKGRPDKEGQADRLSELVQAFEEELAVARREAETKGRDTQMLARLEKLRTGAGTEISYSQADRDYKALFTWYAGDLDQISHESAVATLGKSEIVRELAAALDHWTIVRRETGGYEESDWRKLTQVASGADPDEWRRELRRAWVDNDVAVLRRLSLDAQNRDLDPSSLSLLAFALGDAGDVERAVDLLRRGVERHPDDFLLNYNLAFWLMKIEDWNESVRYHVAALALRPEFPGVWNNLAIVRGELGDSAGERAALEKAIELDETFVRAWYNLAVVHRQQGDLEGATKALEKAVAVNPEYGLALYLLGKTLLDRGFEDVGWMYLREAAQRDVAQANLALAKLRRQEGEYEQALDHLFDAARHDEGDYLSRYHSAWLLEALSRHDAALLAYEHATRIEPEFSLGHEGYVAALARMGRLDDKIEEWKRRFTEDGSDWVSLYRLAIAYQIRERWTDALREYRKLTGELRPDASWAWVGLGYVHSMTQNYVQAEAAYRKAIDLDPKNALAHHDLGATLHRKGEWLAAIEEYQRSLEIEPEDAEAHFNLGFNAIESERVEEGLRHLREAVRIDPGHERALESLVVALCSRRGPGDIDEAVRLSLEALALDPEKADLRGVAGYALGYRGGFDSALRAYREIVPEPDAVKDADFLNTFASARRTGHNDLEEAERAYREGLRLRPDHPNLLVNLCRMLLGAGRDEEGIALCLAALKADPKFAPAHNMLGILLSLRADRDQAVEAYRTAHELAPANEAIRNNLLNSLYARRNVGDREAAEEIALEALDLAPLSLSANQWYGMTLGWRLDAESAKALYEEQFPDRELAQRAYFLYGLAIGLLQESRLVAGAKVVVECIELSPGTIAGDYRIGSVLARMVGLEEAERLYRKWVPDSTDVRTAAFLRGAGDNLGQFWRREYAQSAEAYRRALALLPEGLPSRPAMQAYLVWCLRVLGRWEEGFTFCKKLLDEDPKNLGAWNWTGQLHMDRGEFWEAVSAWRRAGAHQKADPWIFFNVGCAHVFLGQFEEAEDLLGRAAVGNPYASQFLGWHRTAGRLASLESDTMKVLDGRFEPKDAAMALDCARFCLYRGRPAVALRYFEDAVRRNPALGDEFAYRNARHDWTRALVAAAVEAEKGLSGLTPADAPRLRAEALRLLRVEHETQVKREEASPGRTWTGMFHAYWRYDHPEAWRWDPFLRPITDPAERADWPEEEQKRWNEFFAEVETFLEKTGKMVSNPNDERPE